MELYYKYQNQFKHGDLIEFASNSLIGKTIRFFTKKEVNHTSGVVLMSLVEDHEIRRYIWEADEEGFHSTYLSDVVKNYNGKVYWLQLKEEYDNYRLQMIKEALTLDNKPYDYISLIRNALKPVRLNSKNVFCSEAWHLALQKVGLLSTDFNNGYALRPGEFDRTCLYNSPIRIH